MSRTSVRITKFRDRAAFQAVVEFLARLYPDRPALDFERGLAHLPVLLSHDADEAAAHALERALRDRGADLRLTPLPSRAAGGSRPKSTSAVQSGLEIDLAFLDEARRRGASKPASRPSSGPEEGKAPWEE